ncbi:hypothetical protein G3I60_28910 [Streptomyces sp. SID13666]|uniref:DUF4760 domain-containing protein n=1 Tax=unclassified Streptomyces TaxID=2593676 RepID=UPI0013C120D9|nr:MULTISPECIES: hypothetical protein [unclassified Streptomyces]NEA58070.1 hypothetical protein [Streptomyces sp. SID13666]NEA74074.1 hypothetical protein [Streptomyces sp. SID13588]
MNVAALALSIMAVFVSVVVSFRQITLARHSNTLPVVIDLFREHRSDYLTNARSFVYRELSTYDLSQGLAALTEEKQRIVRDLAWFYDNLGALVTHNVVDIEPVSGYLGGSVILIWEKMEPLIRGERIQRNPSTQDPIRWQVYFENLYLLVRETPPQKARSDEKLWRLPE